MRTCVFPYLLQQSLSYVNLAQFIIHPNCALIDLFLIGRIINVIRKILVLRDEYRTLSNILAAHDKESYHFAHMLRFTCNNLSYHEHH